MCECLCIHTNMSLCVSISIYLCTCTRAHILMYTYIDIGYTSRRETLMWDIDAGVRVCVCVYMRVCVHTYIHFHLFCTYVVIYRYGVATCSRLHKIISLFCKRAPWKRRYSAKETCNFKEPSNRSHPILATRLNKREALMWVYVCVCVCVYVCMRVCVCVYTYMPMYWKWTYIHVYRYWSHIWTRGSRWCGCCTTTVTSTTRTWRSVENKKGKKQSQERQPYRNNIFFV